VQNPKCSKILQKFTKTVAEDQTGRLETGRCCVNAANVKHRLVVVDDAIVRPRQLRHIRHQTFFPEHAENALHTACSVSKYWNTLNLHQFRDIILYRSIKNIRVKRRWIEWECKQTSELWYIHNYKLTNTYFISLPHLKKKQKIKW